MWEVPLDCPLDIKVDAIQEVPIYTYFYVPDNNSCVHPMKDAPLLLSELSWSKK